MGSTVLRRRAAVSMHHTRDADGDVIFFLDPCDTARELRQPSPVVGLRRPLSADRDPPGRGNLAKYLIITQNGEYEMQTPCDKTEHPARQLGGPGAEAPR